MDINATIDPYIHVSLKKDAVTYRRARFIIIQMVIGSFLAVAMGIYNVCFKGVDVNTLILLGTLLASIFLILLVKGRGYIKLPAFILCFTIWAASVTSAYKNGGIYSLDLTTILNCIATAYIFSGRKIAWRWFAFVLLTFVVFYLLEVNHVRNFYSEIESSTHEGFYMKKFMALLHTTILVIFFEYTMREQTREIMEKNNMEKVRQQIAKDFHDEMGNKLAAITLNSNLLAMSPQVDERTKEVLGKIERNPKILYQSSRDFIWAIDTKSDDLAEIFDYLKDFGEDFFQSLNISFYTSTFPQELPHLILPPYYGRHIIMLFKEAMTNSAKYSKCTRVDFSVDYREGLLQIEVKDNGEGFEMESVKKGRGLNNMEHRSKQLSGDLLINAVKNKGTQICLKLKL